MNMTGTLSPLPRSLPEEQGIRSTAVSAFLDRIKNLNIELHSLVLLRRGHGAKRTGYCRRLSHRVNCSF